MALPTLEVANELLSHHGEIDHMKLQKLLYFANGWWLATEGEPLLNELPQVWRYGPVFKWLYSTLSGYGHAPIGGPVPAGPFNRNAIPVLGDKPNADRVRALLGWIWNEHGHKSAVQLSDETHAAGTPWRQIAEKHSYKVPQNTPIPPDLDWTYFANLAAARGIRTTPLFVPA